MGVLKAGAGPPSASDIRFDEQVTRTVTRDGFGRVSSITISSTNPASSSTLAITRDTRGRISQIAASGDFARTLTVTRDNFGRISGTTTV